MWEGGKRAVKVCIESQKFHDFVDFRYADTFQLGVVSMVLFLEIECGKGEKIVRKFVLGVKQLILWINIKKIQVQFVWYKWLLLSY